MIWRYYQNQYIWMKICCKWCNRLFTLLATPRQEQGTSIYRNDHSIVNTASIYFKFGTMYIRYMRNHFSGFKRKRTCKMYLMNGKTDNISQAHILAWPGMTSSLTSHGLLDKITHFFLKFVSCNAIWHKMIGLGNGLNTGRLQPISWTYADPITDAYIHQ